MQKLIWLLCGINSTFLQNYYIWQLLTIGQDSQVPVDKPDWLKFYLTPLTP